MVYETGCSVGLPAGFGVQAAKAKTDNPMVVLIKFMVDKFVRSKLQKYAKQRENPFTKLMKGFPEYLVIT
jgi:hypothetical protein